LSRSPDQKIRLGTIEIDALTDVNGILHIHFRAGFRKLRGRPPSALAHQCDNTFSQSFGPPENALAHGPRVAGQLLAYDPSQQTT
jgi:hypothetical protein